MGRFAREGSRLWTMMPYSRHRCRPDGGRERGKSTASHGTGTTPRTPMGSRGFPQHHQWALAGRHVGFHEMRGIPAGMSRDVA